MLSGLTASQSAQIVQANIELSPEETGSAIYKLLLEEGVDDIQRRKISSLIENFSGTVAGNKRVQPPRPIVQTEGGEVSVVGPNFWH